MSKIGKKPIIYDPSQVNITIEKGGIFGNLQVQVKGPKGQLSLDLRPDITVEISEKEIAVKRANDLTKVKALHGLYRSMIANMVKGVTEGFEKKLEIHGVGYRGVQNGRNVELAIGFSHKVVYEPLAGVELKMLDENTILVSGTDKQLVGQVAAEIRILRKPEPYKGKGIRYSGEYVRKKAGKTAAATK